MLSTDPEDLGATFAEFMEAWWNDYQLHHSDAKTRASRHGDATFAAERLVYGELDPRLAKYAVTAGGSIHLSLMSQADIKGVATRVTSNLTMRDLNKRRIRKHVDACEKAIRNGRPLPPAPQLKTQVASPRTVALFSGTLKMILRSAHIGGETQMGLPPKQLTPNS